MSEPLRVISCFAGIEGFGLGFEQSDLRVVAQIEIDKQCNRVLAHHWPDVPRWTDIREVDPAELPHADVVCGGFPCQDLSVAGRRAGLAGERSGLFFEFMRIVAGVRPDWVVIENVPGLLSSNGGRDMATVVGTLVECGYMGAYRVLDAQYFGVAQRRERVFIVGHSRSRTAAAEVLFEPESCAGDSPPSRSAGAGVAGGVSLCLKASGNQKLDDTHETYIYATSPDGSGAPADVSPTLDTRAKDGPRRNQGGVIVADVCGSLTGGSGERGWKMNAENAADGQLVVAPLSASGAGTARTGNERTEAQMLVAHTLTSRYDSSSNGTSGGLPIVPAILHENIGGNLAAADHARALRSGASHNYQMVAAFNPKMGAKAHGIGYAEEQSPTLGAELPTPALVGSAAVRRLTPTECLRLQGFPDDHLDLDPPLADGPKYRMTGNAVCVNVSRWIGRRIASQHTAR